MKQKIYVMLGRYGDIINLLPVIKYEHDQNNYKPGLVVSYNYADLLEGCNYLQPIIFDGRFEKINEAISFVREKHPDHEIINCAVYGHDYHYKRQCHSFLKEAWHKSRCPVAFGQLPLIFDKRDKVRETKLLSELNIKENKKIIVTALSGNSSPLHQADYFLSHLKQRFNQQDYQIIDISNYKATRFYDLLALYEVADTLISIDSAPLHLANAVPDLNVISLVNDKGEWYQSDWKPNHILRMSYKEVQHRIDEIVNVIKNKTHRKIHYLTSMPETPNEETRRRIDFAHDTIKREMIFTQQYWTYNIYKHKLPKIKDMINSVADKNINDDDIIFIVNSDISIVPGLTGLLMEIGKNGAAFFHRHDFKRLEKPLISEVEIQRGSWYIGSDAFAFTKSWWLRNRDIYPDMYYAREAWDMVFRNMIKRSRGIEIFTSIYHEKHKSFWEAKENINCKENSHNRSVGKEWLSRYGGNWLDPLQKNLRYK